MLLQKKHKYPAYICLSAMVLMVTGYPALAATTPDVFMYEGRLLSSGGSAVTTAHTFRFSFWKSADNASGDVAVGAINTLAVNYGGWQEEQTITPNSNGIFSLALGSGTTLPVTDFANHKYMMVEVKAQGAADTAYEIIDPNTGNAAIDRMTIGSLPYSENAEALQNRQTGTASGNILVLRTNALLRAPANTDVVGTLSGASLHAEQSVTSSGTLSVDGASSLQGAATFYNTAIFNEDGGAINFRIESDNEPNMLFVDGTNNRVGIKTSSPDTALDVVGTISGSLLTQNGAGNNYFMGNVGIGTTGPSNKLTVLGNADITGSLGIGTGSPTTGFELDVNGQALISNLAVGANQVNTWITGQDHMMHIVASGTKSPLLVVGGSGVVEVWETTTIPTNNKGVSFGSAKPGSAIEGGEFIFSTYTTSWQERMRITNAGNVGIGTTSPASKLDVEGGVAVGATYSGTSAAPTNGMIIEGNVGIGTTGPSEKLEVVGTVSGATLHAQDTVSSSGAIIATGNIESRGTLSGANLTFMAGADSYILGNVGIGTTGPETNLHIGDYTASPALTLASLSTGSSRINFYYTNNTAGGSIRLIRNGTDSGGRMIFANRWDTDSDKVTFDLTSGNVGIGTTAPAFPLHLQSTVNSSFIAGVENTNTGTAGKAEFRVGQDIQTSNSKYGTFTYYGSGFTPSGQELPNMYALWVAADATNGYLMAVNANAPIKFSTNGSEKVRITGTGNVGIGTTAPVQKLHVVGDGTNSATFMSGAVGIGTTNPSAFSDLHISVVKARLRLESTTGTNIAVMNLINTGGNYYVGADNSAGNGIVTTGGLPYALSFNANGAYPMQFGTNDTVRMTISSTGNVGIGTTSPIKVFTVSGTTLFDNDSGTGSVAISGTNGGHLCVQDIDTGGYTVINTLNGAINSRVALSGECP